MGCATFRPGRSLLAVLLAGLASPPAAAQDPVRVILRNGQEVNGRILGEEGENLRIAVDFGEIRIRRTFVAEIRSTSAAAAPTWKAEALSVPSPRTRRVPAPAPTAGAARAGPNRFAAADEETPPREPERVTAQESGGPVPFDDRIVGALSRYLWFLPFEGGQRLGLGAAILVGLTLLTLLAGRLADIDKRTLGRAALFATCLVVLCGVGFELHAKGSADLLVLAGAGLLAWFGLSRLVLQAGLFRGTVLLACFTFCLLLAVMWVEVMHLAFRQTA